MALPRLPRNDKLIKNIRIAAIEEDFDDDEEHGISTALLLSSLQDASNMIHLHLVNEKKEPFATYKDIDVTGVESVEVPANIFSDNLVYNCFFAHTEAAGFNIELDTAYGRTSPVLFGVPTSYFIDGGNIYFDRKAVTGIARVRYEKLIDKPDLRRGQVTATTGTLPALTTITIDVTDTTFYKAADWTEDPPEYLTINDRDGNVLMRNIPFASYNDSTGVITLDTFTAQSGETCPVGSWVCFGGNSTTHIKLPAISETFFKEYGKTISFEGRSEDNITVATPRMATFLEQIAEVYSQLPSGFQRIPQRGFW